MFLCQLSGRLVERNIFVGFCLFTDFSKLVYCGQHFTPVQVFSCAQTFTTSKPDTSAFIVAGLQKHRRWINGGKSSLKVLLPSQLTESVLRSWVGWGLVLPSVLLVSVQQFHIFSDHSANVGRFPRVQSAA